MILSGQKLLARCIYRWIVFHSAGIVLLDDRCRSHNWHQGIPRGDELSSLGTSRVGDDFMVVVLNWCLNRLDIRLSNDQHIIVVTMLVASCIQKL